MSRWRIGALSRGEKVLASGLVVGILGGLTAFGVFGLFTATTQNAGNEISTGTVAFGDNDAGSALYNLTTARPGDTVSRCIRTTYTGSLPAVVRLYTTSAPGALAQYIDLTITQGTQSSSTFPSCSGFVADATGAIFRGTLQSFEQTNTSYATGIATQPAGQVDWLPNNSLVYRIDATLQAATPDSAQGASSGVHTFIWEARND
jgi:hypothetical protein